MKRIDKQVFAIDPEKVLEAANKPREKWDRKKVEVKLETITDRDTGLTFYYFTWVRNETFYTHAELANDYAGGGGPPFSLLPFDPKSNKGELLRKCIEINENS